MWKIKEKIKNNRFIRGLYFSYRRYGYRRSRFGYLSEKVTFNPPVSFVNPQNIFIYSNCNLGSVYISALNAKFVMKKGCIVASGLNVQTGNHARVIGKFVGDITEKDKPEGYDRDVIIEEDVWIGSNVTILGGVTIGRGATIGAGAVVTKNVPPYSVMGGVPARVIKFYWTVDQIMEHEKKLYPENERLCQDYLEVLLGRGAGTNNTDSMY